MILWVVGHIRGNIFKETGGIKLNLWAIEERSSPQGRPQGPETVYIQVFGKQLFFVPKKREG